MKKIKKCILLLPIVLSIIVTGCKGKIEEERAPEEKAAVSEKEVAEKEPVQAEKPVPPPIGPHSGGDMRKWLDDILADIDSDSLKRAEEHAGKYTAAEIVAGIAVRKKPDYWDTAAEDEKLNTIAIMNTNLSKARISAGFAEEKDVLNSTLYLEDESGKIIAVSDREKGGHLYN